MTRRQALATAMLGSALYAACTPMTDPTQSQVQIYGGTSVGGSRWASTVGLLMDGALCTGTLVAPTLVISAAHCFDGSPASMPVTVVVGNNVDTGVRYRAKRFAINSEYQDNAISDFAYVELAEPINDVEIIPVLSNPAEIELLTRPGAAATLVGFGATETNQVGVKHETTTVVGQSVEGALFIGGNGKDSCQGDSGGPAFGQLPNGEWRVYGITSRGSGCGNGGLLARMYDSICWVEKDSRIKIPSSQKNCGVGSDTLSNSLNLLLGDASSAIPGAYATAVAGDANIARVGLCLGDASVCGAAESILINYDLHPKSAPDRKFFKSRSPLIPTEGLVVTLLGFNQTGGLAARKTVRLDRP